MIFFQQQNIGASISIGREIRCISLYFFALVCSTLAIPFLNLLEVLARWVLLPPEVLPDYFMCDDDCSETQEDDLSVLSWYQHVLPQIKER